MQRVIRKTRCPELDFAVALEFNKPENVEEYVGKYGTDPVEEAFDSRVITIQNGIRTRIRGTKTKPGTRDLAELQAYVDSHQKGVRAEAAPASVRKITAEAKALKEEDREIFAELMELAKTDPGIIAKIKAAHARSKK